MGIAGLDCWLVQSGLQFDLLDWIVIDNPIFLFRSKSSKIKIILSRLLDWDKLDLDWIANTFWKVDLDFQSHFWDGFRLDWQSEKIGLIQSKKMDCEIHLKLTLLLFQFSGYPIYRLMLNVIENPNPIPHFKMDFTVENYYDFYFIHNATFLS